MYIYVQHRCSGTEYCTALFPQCFRRFHIEFSMVSYATSTPIPVRYILQEVRCTRTESPPVRMSPACKWSIRFIRTPYMFIVWLLWPGQTGHLKGFYIAHSRGNFSAHGTYIVAETILFYIAHSSWWSFCISHST